MQGKTNKSQLARIHIARKDLGLDELVYREVLFNETGKRSAADLTYLQAEKVLKYFEAAGWKPKVQDSGFPARGGIQGGKQREGFASPKRLRMIEGLWADLSFAPKDRQKAALREFLWKRFHCSDLRFLTSEGAAKVINALLAMQKGRESVSRESARATIPV